MKSIAFAFTIALAAAYSIAAYAHNDDTHSSTSEEQPMVLALVVPEAEKEAAQEMKKTGPTETSGIESVNLLGTVALAGQIEDVDGYMLRVRKIVFEPGAVVAVHEHNGRPGVAYIISGAITEHRAGADGPVVKRPGDTAFEKTGDVHWWKNETSETASAIVVDLVPEAK